MNSNEATSNNTTARRWPRIVAAIAFLGAVAVAAGLWLFFRDDAPDDVSLASAIETLDSEDPTSNDSFADNTDTAEEATTSAGDADITGEWVIDTESGEFDYESATGSFVGFRIEEELQSIGSTTAVGRTGDIAGSMTIEGTTVTATSFEVDMTTITTNSSNRDDNVQDALETDSFTTASFMLTEPIDLGDNAASGESISVDAVGAMTIHGITNPIEFTIDAQLIDDVVVAVGSTTMTFSDYGVEVPNGGPVISVDDFGVVEFQFLLRQ